MPSPVKYRDFKRYIEQQGWVFSHVKGSHHLFVKPELGTYCVPVHHGEVKYGYFRDIKKICEGK